MRKRNCSQKAVCDGQKRPIPAVPYRIGLITSDTGSDYRPCACDSQTFADDAYSFVSVGGTGTNAAQSMIQALRYFNSRNDLSTVIIGRGGGSFEDLFCFNDEELVREVARSRYPIISAVGHESDTVLTDFAADLRAPTPTAAGELATRHVQDLVRMWMIPLETCGIQCREYWKIIQKSWTCFTMRSCEPIRCSAWKTAGSAASMAKRLLQAKTSYFTEKEHALALFYHKLEASNPLGILQKGYAVVQKAGGVVTDSRELKPGDRVSMRFLHGQARSVIEQAFEEEETDGIQGL